MTPACWSWVVPESPVIGIEGLRAWQDGRCAYCGVRPGSKLVEDHDHETGLTRGLLCRRCNRREGTPSSVEFDSYRSRPPATILGLAVYYGKYRLPPVGACDLASLAQQLAELVTDG